MAAQVVESGRQRTVKPEWWSVLKGCYERMRKWLTTTTPQLATQGDFLRRLARQTTDAPGLEWLAEASPAPSLTLPLALNCGFSV